MSSSLRYIVQSQALRNGEFGKVFGVDCYIPGSLEPSHIDMSWYGIHGVEILFTVMETGCVSVNRMSSKGTDIVAGLWDNERIGTVRGTRKGRNQYGGHAFTE